MAWDAPPLLGSVPLPIETVASSARLQVRIRECGGLAGWRVRGASVGESGRDGGGGGAYLKPECWFRVYRMLCVYFQDIMVLSLTAIFGAFSNADGV
jgi:hypothetical protein